MEHYFCCVCKKIIAEPDDQRIGARHFCREHYARALHASRSRWSRSGLVETALIGVFVALVAWIFSGPRYGTLPTSMGMGMLLSLVPAVIWMVYIYRQDRIEPEPWSLVGGVFLIGGLLGHSIAFPAAEEVFKLSVWGHGSRYSTWIADIAVAATLQQLCTYLAVRYTVYLTDEFDEAVDGVVYATAAALGLVTVANFRFVIQSEGVLPVAGAMEICSNALVHVAAASVLGHGLGRARFEKKGLRGQVFLGLCFLGSIVINGGLKRFATVIGVRGTEFLPGLTFSVASVIGVVILVSIDVLTARLCMSSFEEGSRAHG